MRRAVPRLVFGNSLRDRVSRILLVAIALPLVVMATYIAVSQRSVTAHEAEEQLAGHAQREAAFVESLLEQAEGDIEVIAANPVLSSSDSTVEEISDQLYQSQAFFERFEDVALLNPDGTVVASTGYLYYGPWGPRAVFRDALQGRTSVSELQRIPAGDRYVLVFAAPIFDDLELRGVVAGQMNMERIWGALDSFRIGETGFLAAFDRNGNLVAWPDKQFILTRLEGGPGGTVPVPASGLATITDPGGSRFLARLAPVGGTGWQVGALQARSEVYAIADGVAMKVAVAVVIVFLSSSAALLWLPRALARPLQDLGTGMQRIAEGDFEQRLPVTQVAEIDELSTAFNKMAENLAARTAEQERAERKIRYQADHDGLTGLPNRELIRRRIGEALAGAREDGGSAAVLFLDLDRFKAINDSVGHATGDQLLQAVAERLTRLMPEGATVARLGGDEFLVLLPALSDPSVPDEVSARILDSFMVPWSLGGREFRVTASIGAAVFPDDGEDAPTLMRNADTAMYRAKENGRDGYLRFVPVMNADLLAQVELERDLGRAIERRQLRVHYQPQVRVDTGDVVGVEALVRWEHPERGLLMPDDFVPLAEASGLIVSLGEWVLATACRQAVARRNEGICDCRMAVNVSARELQEPNFYERVAQVIETTAIDPSRLDLEITEGTAMRDVDYTITALQRIRDLGVHVSIDDFGSGYSSLGYLSRLPVDAVKIDKTFVTGITPDSEQASIVGAILALAGTLGLRVVAEGVEKAPQLEVLKQLGCGEYQGFLFSRPVPAEALSGTFAGWPGRSRSSNEAA